MSLSREEHAAILASILENPASANVSEQVTQLAENYAGVLADQTLNADQITTLKKQNEELVQQNMKLFLKVGVGDPKDDTPTGNQEPDPIKYEDLVDETGHIF